MKRFVLQGLLFGFAAWLLFAVAGAPTPVFAQTNLLNNPGFNGGGATADAWFPWHQESNTSGNCTSETMLHQPSWNVEIVGGDGGALWFDGNRSQQVGNQFVTWHGGVVQDVSVNAGSMYRFSFWARGRSSAEQYPAPSDGTVNLNVQAWIDPNGTGNWTNNATFARSPGISPHDTWQQVSVEAVANSSTISVFVGANLGGPGNCRAHLDVWFDAAELVEAGPPPTNTPLPTNTPPPVTNTPWPTNTPTPTNTPIPPTNTPTLTPSITPTPLPTGPWFTETPTAVPPTNTPLPVVILPTATPIPTAVPTDTPESSGDGGGEETQPPTEVPTNTPEPPQGGTICVNTFSDDNANGARDELEGYMAGIPLIVGQGGAVIGQGVSTGSDTPVCFEQLDPGSYEVAQRLPNSLEMTTAGNITLDVASGDRIGLEFGSRLKPETEIEVGTGDTRGEDDESAETVAEAESEPTAEPEDAGEGAEGESAEPDDSGFEVSTVAGIAVMGAAVLLLGGILIALLRQG